MNLVMWNSHYLFSFPPASVKTLSCTGSSPGRTALIKRRLLAHSCDLGQITPLPRGSLIICGMEIMCARLPYFTGPWSNDIRQHIQNGSGKGEELDECSGLLFFLDCSYVLISKLLGLDDCTIKWFISEKHQKPGAHTFSPLGKWSMNG